MIRQAITCDICASEKRQTNHWFVAYEQGGELRVSGWHSRHRLRPGSKHLCGQTCLHKLIDEFMARSISVRAQRAAETGAEAEVEVDEACAEPRPATDTSLTSVTGNVAADAEFESSARLLTPPEPTPSKPAFRFPSEVVTMPPRPRSEDFARFSGETTRYASRTWRAEAWERERERELRAVENRPDIAARRRSNA